MQDSRPSCRANASKSGFEAKPISHQAMRKPELDCPSQSFSEASSTPCTNLFDKAGETSRADVKEEATVSPCEFSDDIDDSLWLDDESLAPFCSSSGTEDGIDFWLQVFMEAGDFEESQEI